MNKPKLSPSMMCADIFEMQHVLDVFKEQHIDLLHIDVMDGHFVPNIAMGTDYVKMLRKNTKIPMDIHLMVEDPLTTLPWFDIQQGDYVSVHVENAVHLQRTLAWIRAKGARAMVALNPATPIFMIEDILPDLDGILVMTVNPGYAGQKVVPQTIEKIARLRAWLNDKGYPGINIEVDGNVSFEYGAKMRRAGADIFVCGTSSVFSKEGTLENNINKFRRCLDEV